MVEAEEHLEDITEHVEGEEFVYDIKIPEERVGVLIGTNGQVKKEIEQLTSSKLDISKEGDVIINGSDALLLYIVRDIVRAIGRGFNPKTALLLLKTDYALEIIDLRDVVGKSKNDMERVKGRVIGTNGRAREEIERLTETYISIYGKTIGIIGEVGQVSLTRQALSMLLSGAMHKTVYNYLERKKKEQLFG